MEAHPVVSVNPALAGPVVALGSAAETQRERERGQLPAGVVGSGVCVLWQETPVSPGGRRQPDLLVWSLLVDDVGAVVTAHLHCQHTALWEHTHTHTVNRMSRNRKKQG